MEFITTDCILLKTLLSICLLNNLLINVNQINY